jgi:hypothetical protein
MPKREHELLTIIYRREGLMMRDMLGVSDEECWLCEHSHATHRYTNRASRIITCPECGTYHTSESVLREKRRLAKDWRGDLLACAAKRKSEAGGYLRLIELSDIRRTIANQLRDEPGERKSK